MDVRLNPSEESAMLAGSAWCYPETEHKEMDVDLATVFAHILDKQKRAIEDSIDLIDAAKFALLAIEMQKPPVLGETNWPFIASRLREAIGKSSIPLPAPYKEGAL